MNELAWIMENWTEIAGVAAAFILMFDRLSKLTPTESDDKIVKNMYKLFYILGFRVRDNPGKVEKVETVVEETKVEGKA